MNINQNKLNPNRRQQWSRVTLAKYVEQRNGVPLREFQFIAKYAATLFWGIIFCRVLAILESYLGLWIREICLFTLATCIANGDCAHHNICDFWRPSRLSDDGVKKICDIFLYALVFYTWRGGCSWTAVKMDLSNYSWWIRASVNLISLILGAILTILAKRVLEFS